jgi:hydroxyacylglutathione hydrolase
MTRIAIHPLRALKDNYVYLVVDQVDQSTAIVDPSEPDPVNQALERLGARPVAIWCTHHHWDHTGAVEALLSRYGALEVYGSSYDGEHGRVPRQTVRLGDGQRFGFGGAEVAAMHIPGHTLGHVAFHLQSDDGGHVFPGDTLFGAGCGRLFEGTPAQMVASLGRLRALPDVTRVWCGHEYTRHLLKFAVTVLPDDPAIAARLARLSAEPDKWTVPLSLVEERATNPFLRWDDPRLHAWAGVPDPVAAFAALRRAKDGWRET